MTLVLLFLMILPGLPVVCHGLEAFGEFWQGLVSGIHSPTIMGKLQGPIAKPGTARPSAGYISVSRNSYYKYIFYACVGDKVNE